MSYAWYGDMEYQRIQANRSKVCNCCDGGRVREHRSSPKPDDPDFVVAVCPTCDKAADE